MGKRKQQRERPKKRSRSDHIKAWMHDYRDLIKAYVVFVLFIIIAFSLLQNSLGSRLVLVPLNRLIAIVGAAVLSLLGTPATASHTSIVSNIASVRILEGCNGVYATIIFLGGVVAYPTGLIKKLIGVLAGTAIIFLINIIRVITLFYLSAYYPSLFDEAHLYIWQFAIIIIGGLLWLIWYDKVVQRAEPTPAV